MGKQPNKPGPVDQLIDCIENNVNILPKSLVARITGQVLSIYTTYGFDDAKNRIQEVVEAIQSSRAIDLLDADNETIRGVASRCAKDIRNIIETVNVSEAYLLGKHQYGIDVPKGTTPDQAVFKLTNEKWWARKLRKLRRQELEIIAYRIQLVGKSSNALYASDAAVLDEKFNLKRQDEWLRNTYIQNADGDQIPLANVMMTPEKKLAEALTVFAGLEQMAHKKGFVWSFITITLPPEYHPNPQSKRGEHTWNGVTPADARKKLMKSWARARSLLNECNVEIFGVRVLEPQNDGTPHLHYIVFHSVYDTLTLDNVLIRYFNQDGQWHTRKWDKKNKCWDDDYRWNTPGLQIVNGNERRGNASNYAFKYMRKGLSFEDGADDVNLRVEAWRKIWGGRSIQWFGVKNALTLWRLLRKLDVCPDDNGGQSPERLNGAVNQAWECARNNYFYGFLQVVAQDRIHTLREQIVTSTGLYEKVIGLIDVETGEAHKLGGTWELITVKRSVPSAPCSGEPGGGRSPPEFVQIRLQW